MDTDDRLLNLTRGATLAIHSYCRVAELQLKMVEQGASPELKGPLGETVQRALEGLHREVEFLRFVREVGPKEKDYQDGL